MAAAIGNKYAAKAKLWESAIKRAVARRADGDVNHGLDKLADKLVNLVEQGELAALKEFGDRIDGKPAQAIVGDSEQPLEVIQRVERVLVRAKSQD